MTKIKLNPEVKQLWVDALRSGNYDQGVQRLHNVTDNTYCCLGVLCDLAVKEGVNVNNVIVPDIFYSTTIEGFDGFYAALPDSVIEWAFGAKRGDKKFSTLVRLNTPIEDLNARYLTDLNDDSKLTLEQIADVIEEQF